MSALTKIFVLLLIILSIVETAGIVVYVNRQEYYAASLTSTKAQLAAATARAAADETQLGISDNHAAQVEAQLQNQRNLSQQVIDQLRSAVTDRDTQIAKLQNDVDLATLGQKSANDALVVAQNTVNTQAGQIAELRKSSLDLETRNSEQSLAINDLTNKYEVTNRQWRDSLEQITQLQNDLKSARDTIHKSGISQNNAPVLNSESLINVSGVVRSRETIGGVPTATISVGSADQVSKGMQFKLIDPNSNTPFLGYLIVDRVEPNEAIGHLQGPRIDQVRPGTEARTQLY